MASQFADDIVASAVFLLASGIIEVGTCMWQVGSLVPDLLVDGLSFHQLGFCGIRLDSSVRYRFDNFGWSTVAVVKLLFFLLLSIGLSKLFDHRVITDVAGDFFGGGKRSLLGALAVVIPPSVDDCGADGALDEPLVARFAVDNQAHSDGPRQAHNRWRVEFRGGLQLDLGENCVLDGVQCDCTLGGGDSALFQILNGATGGHRYGNFNDSTGPL